MRRLPLRSPKLMRHLLLIVLSFTLLLLIATVLAVGAGQLVAYFQQGADPASALNIVPNRPIDWPIELTWQPDSADSGRKMEPFTREQIESAYTRAWLQWRFSYQKGEPHGLKTYFVGPALEAVQQSVLTAQASHWQIEQVDTRHNLKLRFYSADGSIVSFTDSHVQLAQLVTDSKGQTLSSNETTSVYEVVMLLDDGNWRVRHWLRVAEKPTTKPTPKKLPSNLVGINYYPRDTPWDRFWENYSAETTAQDLALIKQLEINAVRIFIPYGTFGRDKVDAEQLAHLLNFLDQAEQQQIGVILTLFDFHTDYKMNEWPRADRYIDAVVSAVANHSALLAWDVKNEPDLDYAANGKALTQLWLTHSIAQIRRNDPKHPITIGWATPQAAADLIDQVDFVSYHYYGDPQKLVAAHQQLRYLTDKPIVLQEFGLSTWNPWWWSGGHTMAEQATYFADLLAAWRKTDSAGYFVWTLHDFSYIPKQAVGGQPWKQSPQKNMGIIRANGKKKPSAELISPSAELKSYPRPAAYTEWLKPFRLTLLGLIIVCLRFFWKKRDEKDRSL